MNRERVPFEGVGRTSCNCISSNDPEAEQTDPPILLTHPIVPNKTVSIDACIADVIRALWDAGCETVGSCCGHNAVPPSIVVENNATDDDVLWIRTIIGSADTREWDILSWTLLRHKSSGTVERALNPTSAEVYAAQKRKPRS